jgi:thiol-disulfide isomerase/thioredoxin
VGRAGRTGGDRARADLPKVEALLERPFARIPQKQFATGGNGFGLGMALGVLYVPCAGPVLAAIVVAGATGTIGLNTVVLTCAFALGAALPLLFFALAGRRFAERVTAFRRRQREIRIGAGIVTILLAVALVFNLPAALQRAIPDYTSSLQNKVGSDEQIRDELNLGGIVNEQNAQLSNCTNGGQEPETCGPAPDIKGITKWLNTPDGAPVSLASLRGKVVLVDFWAYSCINCQRAIPHIAQWYNTYKSAGFEVIGVHTPEYAFERVAGNVAKGAADLGITYPVALDNSYSTWTNYRNRYWPAKYLIDANGTVRHIKFGEGDYDVSEKLIRQLLSDAKPVVALPEPLDTADLTPQSSTTPETYLGAGKMVNFAGGGCTTRAQRHSTTRSHSLLTRSRCAVSGRWTIKVRRPTTARRRSGSTTTQRTSTSSSGAPARSR